MKREQLRAYLHNPPLILAIAQKEAVDKTRKRLIDAVNLMCGLGISKAAQAEVNGKLDEYAKISRNYGNFLEDTWGVTWQAEIVIKAYADYPDDEIDQLPETLTT